jgi:hypothetical protein
MSERDPGLEAFSKFIVALEPWLGEVVLVGGWARRLWIFPTNFYCYV